MELFVGFTGRGDGIDQEFPDAEITSMEIRGNRIVLHSRDGVVARAELFLDHNRPLWRVRRGARGHEIGDFPEVRVSI